MSINTSGIPFWPRIGLAIICLIFVGGGVRWAASQAIPSELRLPTPQQLAALPYQLGPWKGEDQKVDPRLIQAVGTNLQINRIYQQSVARAAGIHMAVFTNPDFSLPHPAELCYSGTGWQVRRTRDARLILSDGTSGTVRIISLVKEQGGETATVLYCYQLAGPFAADRDKVRSFFWRYRGQKARPPLVKVMVHLTGDGQQTEDLGLDLAQRILEKLAELEKTW